MLKKLLFRHQQKKQLIIAVLGTLIGFVFLLSSLHYFIKTRQLGEGKEILGSNLLIAQKEVSKFNALGVKSNLFSDDEIKEIKSLPFVIKAAPITNNQFEISLGMHEEGLPYFRTDIFVQSVDKELMDIELDDWKWDESQKYIPLVMPRDFMVMLNQFATSYHIPQVSEDLAKTITFRLDVAGNSEKQGFDAHIIGFSNQISAVLVPSEFMNYANEKYGDHAPITVSQIMMSVKPNAFGKLQEVMDEQNLDIKKSDLTITKVKSILTAVLTIILVIGVLIILLSGLIVFQYTQLLISKSDYEITTLLRLGYHPKRLANLFLSYFIKIFGLIFISAYLGFLGLKIYLDGFFKASGFPVDEKASYLEILVLILIVVGIILINFISVKQTLTKKIKNR